MYVLDQVSKKLPNIFKGVKRELTIKIERNIRILFKLIAYVIAYVMKKLFLLFQYFF